MGGFLELAPESFDQIIAYLNNHEKINLWICGDLKLHWRLSTGRAIRKMAVKWSYWSKCLWPSQIIKLEGLEIFSFNNLNAESDKQLSDVHLSTLSRNLKELNLECIAPLPALNRLYSVNPCPFPSLRSLNLRVGVGNNPFEFEIPSTVTELGVWSPRRATIQLPLSCLSPNLTKLEATVTNLELGNLRFPKTLNTIRLRIRQTTPWVDILTALPCEIENISLEDLAEHIPTMDDWKAMSMFTNLKTLEIPVYSSFGVPEAQMIPRSLKVLRLEEVDSFTMREEEYIAVLQALPRQLRELDGIWRNSITPGIAKNLPRTLCNALDEYVVPEAVPFIPDLITSLRMEAGDMGLISRFPSHLAKLLLYMLPLSLAAKLPAGLQSLAIQDRELALTGALVERLPRALKELTLYVTADPIQDVEDVLKALPPSLTILKASVGPFDPMKMVSSSSEFVLHSTPSNSSLLLPRCMSDLTLGCLDFPEGHLVDWILGLPTQLTILDLLINRLQKGAFTSFSALVNLRELCIRVVNTPQDGWASNLDFRSLSRKLTKLSLFDYNDGFEATNISDDSLIGSPTTLTEFRIPLSPLLTKACMVHLPHLRDFWFGSEYDAVPEWFKGMKKKFRA
jgi:hypothetical protein